ncbi:hypothetical protein P43SY_011296 [Pythium insidiosum]|uniref:Uncharacterized protein n=1 Tax=Pythium insidiosum TaxID=114742 RepID=A0AAD5L4X8_PYTIN|nr:hypothetical protein P43SY_011296 [Pythium insidiosum]
MVNLKTIIASVAVASVSVSDAQLFQVGGLRGGGLFAQPANNGGGFLNGLIGGLIPQPANNNGGGGFLNGLIGGLIPKPTNNNGAGGIGINTGINP